MRGLQEWASLVTLASGFLGLLGSGAWMWAQYRSDRARLGRNEKRLEELERTVEDLASATDVRTATLRGWLFHLQLYLAQTHERVFGRPMLSRDERGNEWPDLQDSRDERL